MGSSPTTHYIERPGDLSGEWVLTHSRPDLSPTVRRTRRPPWVGTWEDTYREGFYLTGWWGLPPTTTF